MSEGVAMRRHGSGAGPQFDEGQMLASACEGDAQFERRALAFARGRARGGAGRGCGPAHARFVAWLGVARTNACVGFLGRFAAEGGVRTGLVVPAKERVEFTPQVLPAQGDCDAAEAFVFERSDESLDDGDAAVLADGAEARPDAVASAPGLEPRAPELTALVGDDVSRRLACCGDGTAKDGAHSGNLVGR